MMADFSARPLWLLIVTVVFISCWLRPSECAKAQRDGASGASQPPSTDSHIEQQSTEERDAGRITAGSQSLPELPIRQGRPLTLQRNLHVPPHSSAHAHLEAHTPQRSPALNPDISGHTHTGGAGQSQRVGYLVYDLPSGQTGLPEVETQRHGRSHYDIPRSHAGSQSTLGTQRHPSSAYDFPKSTESTYDVPSSVTRLGGNDQAPRKPHQHPTGTRQQKKFVSSASFDWLRESVPLSTVEIPEARVHRPNVGLGAFNTIAGTRSRASVEAHQLDSSRPLTFTLPRSLGSQKRDGSSLLTSSQEADPTNVAESQPRKQPDARSRVEILDSPNDASAQRDITFRHKVDSRSILSQLLGKVGLSSSRTRAKSKSEDNSASSSTASVSEASARGASADWKHVSLARRKLPPLPAEAPENRPEGTKEALSVDSAYNPEIWDDMIRKELSPPILSAVLQCEQRVLKALKSGKLMDFLTEPEAVEEFQFLARMIAYFSKGLDLTPAEQLFNMWALECSTPSARCPTEVLLEVVPIFEFVAGVRPLHVPPAVEVLLSSGNDVKASSAQRVPSPALATGGTALRTTIPERPFALFLHRISSDSVRRQTVRELVQSWPRFTAEVKYLLFFNGLAKSLDYSTYRTRFIVYAYTVAAVKLPSKSTASLNPIDFAVHGCFEDLLLLRRMAHPEVRNTFCENLRRSYAVHIRRNPWIPG